MGAGVPRFELAYLYGSSAAGAVVAMLVLLRPAWVVPLWWIFTLLADGPHLIATLTRSYLDPRDRRRLGRAAWLAPLWILLGPAALLAGKLSGSGAPWQLFLALAGVWSTYHFIRQHAGLLAVCERRAGAEPRTMRVDALFLQGALWAMTLVYVLAVPGGRRAIGLTPFAGEGEEEVAYAIALALAAATIGWLGRLVARPRRRWLAASFLFGPVFTLYLLNLFVVGAREPLFAGAANAEQTVLGVSLVGGLVHALQYLGIVAATNRRRAQRDGDTGAARLAARLGRAPLATYAVLMVVSVVAYGLLNAARGGPGLAFFALESDAARLFLGVYWGLFFAHYHLDQIIWHPSRDPDLRAELGLVSPAVEGL